VRADAPALPRRNPTPSLLTALLTDHLDPGYAAAARSPGSPRRRAPWTAAGALAVGLVFGLAVVQAGAPGTDAVRSGLVADVQAARRSTDELAARRAELTVTADGVRSTALAGNAQGQAALAELRRLQALAAATAVTGPGLQVTVTDTVATTRSGSGSQRGTVLDRDLQLVVNDLWAAGAEAIAVGGVRLNPTSTVRRQGGRCWWTTSRSPRRTSSPRSATPLGSRPSSWSVMPTCGWPRWSKCTGSGSPCSPATG